MQNLSQFWVDGMICMVGLAFWFVFFAQFTLPVRTLSERISTVERLLLYVTGSHGPAVFIKNGKIQAHKGEALKRGPGVVLLDTASGAALRTSTEFRRAIGPGVAFTDFGEQIAGTVDLRKQNNGIGPKNTEDPFAPKGEEESEEEYALRQKRRWETRALTRDGIEVAPSVSVNFRLDARPGEGNSEFGFNDMAVTKAIIGRYVDLNASQDAPDRVKEWYELPARLAVDLWREYVARFTLNQLFEGPNGTDGAMTQIIRQVRGRLTQEYVDAFDDFGRPLADVDEAGAQKPKKVKSEEFRLLKNRGLLILSVSISNLRLPAEVEDQLVNRWKTTWLLRANRERDIIEQRRRLVQRQGRQDGLVDYALTTARVVADMPPEEAEDARLAALAVLRAHRKRCEKDPTFMRVSDQTLANIDELILWLEGGEPV